MTNVKGNYKGTIFMVTCFDSNKQKFFLAFIVGNLKNEASYVWLFKRFDKAYSYIAGLTFITNIYKGLKRTIAKLNPNAYHINYIY